MIVSGMAIKYTEEELIIIIKQRLKDTSTYRNIYGAEANAKQILRLCTQLKELGVYNWE